MSETINDKSGSKLDEIINAASVSADEVEKFHKISENWWESNSEMYALKLMNRLRIPFIKKGIFDNGLVKECNRNNEKPFEGLKILDAGCGGGFLSEAIANLGAQVTALDASKHLIDIANSHKQLDDYVARRLTYLHVTIEEFAPKHEEYFDIVITSEVIEHIIEKTAFLKHCISCLKPGGSLFVTTISQNIISRTAIFLCEYLMKVVPRGTHEYDKLISPSDLKLILRKYNCKARRIRGLTYNPFTQKWFWVPTTSINYFMHAVKDV